MSQHPDDLIQTLALSSVVRAKSVAAETLLSIWKERPHTSGISIDHIREVVTYAPEPYKSEAEQIIREYL